jgi:hypothetical protein
MKDMTATENDLVIELEVFIANGACLFTDIMFSSLQKFGFNVFPLILRLG